MGMFDDLIPAGQPAPPKGGMFDDLIPQAPQPGGLSLIETTPATPTAPARVVMDTSGRGTRPMSVLPTSAGGAMRDVAIGAQGAGKGLMDIVTGPFDLVAGAQNLVTSGINKVLGTSIPMATPASKLAEQGADAVGLGDLFLDPETLSPAEKLSYNVNRFGTQAVGLGSALARNAPAVAAQTKPRGLLQGGVGDAMARPYVADAGMALKGDAIGGAGAGVGVTAADEWIPEETPMFGKWPKQIANFLAPIVGAVGANTAQGAAQGVGGAIRNAARNRLTTETEIPLNPNTGKAYSATEVDRAAQMMQADQKSPDLTARTIRENADELAKPKLPGETPVEASQIPTAGLLSGDPRLVTMEEGARTRNRAPFIERDQNVKEAAGERVESLRDPEADLGSVMRRAGEARAERLQPAEASVNWAEAGQELANHRRTVEGAAYTPIANSEAKANASRRLDRAVVDENYIPARAEKNRQFDEAPGRAQELPADDVLAAADRVRRNANELAPGTLPNDFLRRLDELRPQIDETGANIGGPGTAGGGDLADLRKFVGDAQQRAQASGNFDLADNLGTLKTAINRTIEQAPGYAEANANYGRFADRFRPERNDPGAQFTKEIDRGGQQPDGTLNRGATPPSETAGRFLSGPENAAALQRIMADSPSQQAGNAAVRDYLRADFATSALNPDGTLNANRAAAWSRNNADVLAQFPAVRTEFDNIAATARRGEQLSADAKRGLDAARADRRSTEANVDRSAIGTLLKEDPRDVAAGILSGKFSSEAKLDEIKKIIGSDKEAARGWKAAVSEVLAKKVQSTRKIGETPEVQYANLAKQFKDNEALLAKTFSPEEMNTLRQGHKLLSYFKEAEKRATTGSQTAERASIIPPGAQLALRHVYGDLKGGGIIKRWKTMIELLPSSKQGAQEIVDAAWFDPNVAAFLLERKLPDPNAKFNNVPLRRLMGAANAARESGPDED